MCLELTDRTYYGSYCPCSSPLQSWSESVEDDTYFLSDEAGGFGEKRLTDVVFQH